MFVKYQKWSQRQELFIKYPSLEVREIAFLFVTIPSIGVLKRLTSLSVKSIQRFMTLGALERLWTETLSPVYKKLNLIKKNIILK